MAEHSIYRDIAERTGGDIYIGVVGPVRSGKSTFITRFMQELVLPNIEAEAVRERARDEMPQSAAGRTVMTTEPKFVPEKGVRIKMEEDLGFQVAAYYSYSSNKNSNYDMNGINNLGFKLGLAF